MMLTIKRGDKYPLTFTVNMDLTGASVRLLVKSPLGLVEELPSAIQDASAGTVVHHLTGTLAPGTYTVELEVTQGGQIVTFPSASFEELRVVNDLG